MTSEVQHRAFKSEDNMRVYITEGNKETAVEIHCVTADDKTRRLQKYIEAYGSALSGRADGETRIVPLNEILYFESVDGRTFIYTRDNVLETDKKLYELEELLDPADFYRCGKSCIININAVERLRPEISRNITAFMKGGDAITISRRYVSGFKAIIERGAGK